MPPLPEPEWAMDFAPSAEVFPAHFVIEREAKLIARVAELEALSERLKLEAQIHAQEAHTANATIAEIYQCVTGKTGEPGNWNGAEPVRARLAELEDALRDLEAMAERYRPLGYPRPDAQKKAIAALTSNKEQP